MPIWIWALLLGLGIGVLAALCQEYTTKEEIAALAKSRQESNHANPIDGQGALDR